MKKKDTKKTCSFCGINKIGSLAFIVGVIIAIVAGFWPLGTVMTSILILLGIVVGFLNITEKEINNFLFSALVLVVISSLGGQVVGSIQYIGPFLQSVLTAMVVFIVPATLVVALKAIAGLAEK